MRRRQVDQLAKIMENILIDQCGATVLTAAVHDTVTDYGDIRGTG
jgi:hypothetical protein